MQIGITFFKKHLVSYADLPIFAHVNNKLLIIKAKIQQKFKLCK